MRRHLSRGMIERVRKYGYTTGLCVYCGVPCGAGLYCASHADLRHFDPLMLAAGRATVKERPGARRAPSKPGRHA